MHQSLKDDGFSYLCPHNIHPNPFIIENCLANYHNTYCVSIRLINQMGVSYLQFVITDVELRLLEHRPIVRRILTCPLAGNVQEVSIIWLQIITFIGRLV